MPTTAPPRAGGHPHTPYDDVKTALRGVSHAYACFAALAELKELDVSDTNVGDSALAPLAGRLRILAFCGSHVTDAAKSCLEPDE